MFGRPGRLAGPFLFAAACRGRRSLAVAASRPLTPYGLMASGSFLLLVTKTEISARPPRFCWKRCDPASGVSSLFIL